MAFDTGGNEGNKDRKQPSFTSLASVGFPFLAAKRQKGTAQRSRNPSSANFQVCCVAGFQTRCWGNVWCAADLEVGDTTGLETCATKADGRCLEKSSREWMILTDSNAKNSNREICACRAIASATAETTRKTSLFESTAACRVDLPRRSQAEM